MQKAFWYFLNKLDSTEIRFQGSAVQAEAFWDTLKSHCDGEWILQLERSMNALMQAQAAPAPAQPAREERTRTLSMEEGAAPLQASAQVQAQAQAPAQVQAQAVPAPLAASALQQAAPSLGAQVASALPPRPEATRVTRATQMTAATALRTLSIEMPLSDPGAEPSPVATPVASAAAVIATDPAGTVSLSLEPLETDTAPPTLFSTALPSGKRKYARYALPFRVILTSGKNSFRTYSSNISVGGMLLKNPLPKVMLEGACRIFIGRTTSPENIELTCQLAGDARDPCRVRFVESDSAKLKKLEQWVLEALQNNRAA